MKAFVALVAFLLTAGCVAVPETPQTPIDDVAALLAADGSQALWADPQLAPHPAFNWPTITHVPVGGPDWWQPIASRPLPDPIAGLDHLAQAGTGSGGDGIALFGGLGINPSGVIFDLRDPANPVVLNDLDVQPGGRQVVLMPYPDGRLLAAFATGSGYIPVWDISDPKNSTELSVIDVASGGHTIAVVPGTPILYNANAVGSRYYPHELSGGQSIQQVEIYDLTVPDDPQLVQEWKGGYGCHAISFHITADKQRAYCAAVDSTQIWDITNPKAPSVIATAPMPHGQDPAPGYPILAAVSHYVVVNADASVMGVADEFLGGVGPGCDVYAREADKTVSGPAGNVYFYNIEDESNPTLLGWVNPGSHFTYNRDDGLSCTAHVGHMIPTPDRNLLAMSFYAGGVALIDFTDASDPYIVDAWQQTSPMDVWYYNGYLFAGDASKGLDIFTLE